MKMTLKMRRFNIINCFWTVLIFNVTTFIGCISGCDPPGTRDILITTSPDRFIYNLYDVVSLACPTGYQLVGPRRVFCKPGGSWHRDTTITSCRGSCSLDYLESEVEVTVNDEKVMTGPVPSGDVAYFSCDGMLIGNRVSTCYDQSWSPEIPSCLASCSLLSLPGYEISESDTHLAVGHDDQVVYNCKSNEIKATCSDGLWMQDAQCVVCGFLVFNDPEVVADVTKQWYQPFDEVVLSCPQTHLLSGPKNLSCTEDGSWDFSPASVACTAKSCGKPPLMDNIVVLTPDTTEYPNGTEIHLSCPTGYTLYGDTSALCEYGIWNIVDEPMCQASPCDSPVPADDLVILIPDQLMYQNGTGVEFVCPSGYELFGDNETLCVYGEWDLVKEPYCEEMLCPRPVLNDILVILSPDQDEYQNGTHLNFSCPSGYKLSGELVAVCFEGVLEYQEPHCLAAPCERPIIVDDMVMLSPSQQEYDNGTAVIFSCPAGHYLIGDSSALCEYGELNIKDEPSCQAAFCGTPTIVDGLVVLTPDLQKYPNWTSVFFSCPPEHDLVGDLSVLCEYGIWNISKEPSCQAKPCDQPVLGDALVITVPDETEYSNGTELEFICPSGYDLHGASNALCLYGMFEIMENPYCQASPCGRPVSTDSVVLLIPDRPSSEYENGTGVNFSCPTGYDLQGDFDSLCLYGVWDFTQEPTCQASPCDIPVLTDELLVVSPNQSEYANGTQIYYWCPNGYELQGSSTSICLYGVWYITQEPSCNALPCTSLSQNDPSVIVSPNLTTYASGLEILYSCPTGYVVNGTVFTFCELGNWKPPDTPECVSCNLTTQCALDSTRLDRDVLCTEEPHGNTDPPCYGHWSRFLACKCPDPDYRLTHSNFVYWCSDQNGWDEMLYSLECRAPCSVSLNENVIATNSAGNETAIIQDGDYVQYSCPEGYMENGPAKVSCSDGTWMMSQPFFCIKQ